jgi:hypothetical protein
MAAVSEISADSSRYCESCGSRGVAAAALTGTAPLTAPQTIACFREGRDAGQLGALDYVFTT